MVLDAGYCITCGEMNHANDVKNRKLEVFCLFLPEVQQIFLLFSRTLLKRTISVYWMVYGPLLA